MRMWMLPPETMCRKHLLGEHVELHMLLGSLRRGKNIDGFLAGKLVDPRRMFRRHEELVLEMERRGYRHASPLDEAECETLARRYGRTGHGDRCRSQRRRTGPQMPGVRKTPPPPLAREAPGPGLFVPVRFP